MQEPLDTDVAIAGAGVVGCAIARELTRFDLRVTLCVGIPVERWTGSVDPGAWPVRVRVGPCG